MALIPWKPFSDLERFFEDEDWLLPVFPGGGIAKPAMDIYETDKEVVAEVNIPGYDPEKIDISVENGILKVSGKMEEKKRGKGKGILAKRNQKRIV